MVITLTWQLRVLGVADEESFVRGISDSVRRLILNIASEAA
jgi:hypothetical protein